MADNRLVLSTEVLNAAIVRWADKMRAQDQRNEIPDAMFADPAV